MNKLKEYRLGIEGRKAIKSVSKQVGDILGKTLGLAGRNYFLPQGITNDGRTIVSEIRFENEIEDQVSLAYHEVASRTDKDVGDGTTTSMVLASQLTQDLIDKVADIDAPSPNEMPVLSLYRQLDEEKDKVLDILKGKVRKIKNKEDLENVAMTAMEHSEGAKIVADTMWEAGKDSFPVLDKGFNEKIEKDVIQGVAYPLNIAHNSMFNQVNKAEYVDVPILVVNHNFEEYNELAPFFLSMLQDTQKNKPPALVIVAKQFSVPFVNSVAEAVLRTKFPMVLVSANLHSDTFKDIAAYVDANLVDTHPKAGKKITDVVFKDVGIAKKVIAMEKETKFIKGRGLEARILNQQGSISRVGQRVEEIEYQLKTEKSPKEREQMERRIGALQGGIATIYVDAKTAVERYYLKLKVEDAMNSCRAALNGGMVEGGGVTLKNIAEELGEGSLLYNTLSKPYNKIIQNNMGIIPDTKDVEDAYLVVKSSFENAISVVKVLLSVEGIISNSTPSMVESLKQVINE